MAFSIGKNIPVLHRATFGPTDAGTDILLDTAPALDVDNIVEGCLKN